MVRLLTFYHFKRAVALRFLLVSVIERLVAALVAATRAAVDPSFISSSAMMVFYLIVSTLSVCSLQV